MLAKYKPCWLTPKRQDVVVIRQPPHLSALHSPFRSIERHPRAISLRQREPPTDVADDSTDQKPQEKKVDRKERHKHGGMLVNQALEIHACQENVNLFGPTPPSSSLL